MFWIQRSRLCSGLLLLSLGSYANYSLVALAQQASIDGATILLPEAIHRAQQNEVVFAAAVAAQKTASIDGYLAKAALLPSVTYHNQML